MTDRPIRIQSRRTKGWRIPADTIYVGRPSMWGNPFRHPDPAVAVRMYRAWINSTMRTMAMLECTKALPGPLDERLLRIRAEVRMLHGMNLACWCGPGQPCHADVLLEVANG